MSDACKAENGSKSMCDSRFCKLEEEVRSIKKVLMGNGDMESIDHSVIRQLVEIEHSISCLDRKMATAGRVLWAIAVILIGLMASGAYNWLWRVQGHVS